MKFTAAFLFLVTFTATNAFSMGNTSNGGTPGAGNTGGQPASFGDTDTLLHRPTPTPAPAGSSASKEKKPLTATLGKDNSGKGETTTFASTDPKIYLVWKAETGIKGEKVHITWYSEGAKARKLTEATQTIPGTGSISGSSFIEKPASGFPVGKYRVDVSDDGKLAKSIKFTVAK